MLVYYTNKIYLCFIGCSAVQGFVFTRFNLLHLHSWACYAFPINLTVNY
jgi:hypothetical protein